MIVPFLLPQKRCTASRGFVIPMTLIVCSIILVVATSISTILTKQLYFSKVSRLSELAYYAADTALACATMIDDQYVDDTGMGIFPHDALSSDPIADMQAVLDSANVRRSFRNLSALELRDIVCATSAPFDVDVSEFTTSPFSRTLSDSTTETGLTSTYTMHMDLGDESYRCARVIVSKTQTYRQIVAAGYAACNGSGASIERALVTTTELQ